MTLILDLSTIIFEGEGHPGTFLSERAGDEWRSEEEASEGLFSIVAALIA